MGSMLWLAWLALLVTCRHSCKQRKLACKHAQLLPCRGRIPDGAHACGGRGQRLNVCFEPRCVGSMLWMTWLAYRALLVTRMQHESGP